ncbi:hypothetical protein [Streptomyces sp. NPDC004042]|uniref:hypothetical protein n=1 Tax=Streptomyces sp. NPDC004042 TaxID=3154451 RepID=UPI0033B238D9
MVQNAHADSPCLDLADAIRKIAPKTTLVRIYPEHRSVTHLFESDFYRLHIDRRTEEKVARMVKCRFEDVADWHLTHDFYLPSTTLYLAPEPDQNGYIPEDDRSFGISLARRISIVDGGFR